MWLSEWFTRILRIHRARLRTEDWLLRCMLCCLCDRGMAQGPEETSKHLLIQSVDKTTLQKWKWVKNIHRMLAVGWWFLSPLRTMSWEQLAKEMQDQIYVYQQVESSPNNCSQSGDPNSCPSRGTARNGEKHSFVKECLAADSISHLTRVSSCSSTGWSRATEEKGRQRWKREKQLGCCLPFSLTSSNAWQPCCV